MCFLLKLRHGPVSRASQSFCWFVDKLLSNDGLNVLVFSETGETDRGVNGQRY